MVIALGAVLIAHLVGLAGRGAAGQGSQTGNQQPAKAGAPRPEFYLTATYPASGQNVLQFQVRRTDGGAVTSSTSIPGSVSWGGYLSVAAGDRAFYIGEYQCIKTAIPRTTFYRITITGSGRISGMAPAGPPVAGMVTTLAVSPDGSRMAYSALQHACAAGAKSLQALLKGASSVNVTDLSTGTVRTWQDASSQLEMVTRLSWAQNGRTLIVDERPTGPQHQDLTVFGLDTTSGGGSLQAHSAALLRQASNCSSCVRAALAGPNGSLIVLEAEGAGLKVRISVVRIPSTGGSRTVLFSRDLYDTGSTGLFADPSGQWVLLWPTSAIGTPETGPPLPTSAVGWISGGRLHPLPGVGQVFPQGIAW